MRLRISAQTEWKRSCSSTHFGRSFSIQPITDIIRACISSTLVKFQQMASLWNTRLRSRRIVLSGVEIDSCVVCLALAYMGTPCGWISTTCVHIRCWAATPKSPWWVLQRPSRAWLFLLFVLCVCWHRWYSGSGFLILVLMGIQHTNLLCLSCFATPDTKRCAVSLRRWKDKCIAIRTASGCIRNVRWHGFHCRDRAHNIAPCAVSRKLFRRNPCVTL